MIKKNLIYEKPKNYTKIQIHNKEINSKANNSTIAPERYHSSKLLQDMPTGVKAPKEKLLPVHKDQPLQMKPMAAPKDLQMSQTLKGDRKEPNDLLS